MQASSLLDKEGLPVTEQPTSPPPPAVRAVLTSMRRLTVHFSPTTNTTATAATAAPEPIVLHISFQGFMDALWVLVTEDVTCAPGVILCHDGMPEELRAGTFFKFNGETPSVECEVLLGLRDHPLTNLVASSVAHAIRSFGEARALIMCVSVMQAAKVLQSTDDKRALLALVKETVMDLANGAGEAL